MLIFLTFLAISPRASSAHRLNLGTLYGTQRLRFALGPGVGQRQHHPCGLPHISIVWPSGWGGLHTKDAPTRPYPLATPPPQTAWLHVSRPVPGAGGGGRGPPPAPPLPPASITEAWGEVLGAMVPWGGVAVILQFSSPSGQGGALRSSLPWGGLQGSSACSASVSDGVSST